MNLRLRCNNNNIIDTIAFISIPDNGNPKLSKIFPGDYEIRRNLDQLLTFFSTFKETLFAYQSPFTITLTSQTGVFTFCHCIICPISRMITCILSSMSCHKYFFELCSVLNFLLIDNQLNDIEDIVNTVLKSKIDTDLIPKDYFTPSGINIRFKRSKRFATDFSKMFYDEKGYIKELCQSLNVNVLISIYEAMIFEKKILLASKTIYKLMCCVHGILEFIRPFEWQCRLIPIIYSDSYKSLSFPNPYIIGIPHSELSKITLSDISDLLVVDLDNSCIIRNILWGKIRLPPKIKTYLQGKLVGFFNNNIEWTTFDGEKVLDIIMIATTLFLSLNDRQIDKKLKKEFSKSYSKEMNLIKNTKYFQKYFDLVPDFSKQVKPYNRNKSVPSRKASLFQNKKQSIMEDFD